MPDVSRLVSRALSSGIVTDIRSTPRTAVAFLRSLGHPSNARQASFQVLKSAFAAVASWEIAVRLLQSSRPFYAPLAALLVVQFTVYRSVSQATSRVIAVVLGVLAAWLVGSTMGVSAVSLLLVLIPSIALGRWRQFGGQGLQVPVTALFTLIIAGGTETSYIYARVFETLVGAAVGVIFNLLLVPPLHVGTAAAAIRGLADETAELVGDIATGLRDDWSADDAQGWLDRSRHLDSRADQVRTLLEQGRESIRFNPRRLLRREPFPVDAYSSAVTTLDRIGSAVSGIARTIADVYDEQAHEHPPSRQFLVSYAHVLDDAAAGVAAFGRYDRTPELGTLGTTLNDRVQHAFEQHGRLVNEVRETRVDDPAAWPAYGELLTDAGRLLDELVHNDPSSAIPNP